MMFRRLKLFIALSLLVFTFVVGGVIAFAFLETTPDTIVAPTVAPKEIPKQPIIVDAKKEEPKLILTPVKKSEPVVVAPTPPPAPKVVIHRTRRRRSRAS